MDIFPARAGFPDCFPFFDGGGGVERRGWLGEGLNRICVINKNRALAEYRADWPAVSSLSPSVFRIKTNTSDCWYRSMGLFSGGYPRRIINGRANIGNILFQNRESRIIPQIRFIFIFSKIFTLSRKQILVRQGEIKSGHCRYKINFNLKCMDNYLLRPVPIFPATVMFLER